MQTTLLGLAVALILALVTALVGPLLIDWGRYRASFEAEASRLIGTPVSVGGAIDVRLLPTPSLLLRDIETGARFAEPTLRARALRVEFALGPLVRGEWRADELRLDAPEIKLGLDAAGQIETPPLAIGFDPDQLSVERLVIENGRLTFTDAASGEHGDARQALLQRRRCARSTDRSRARARSSPPDSSTAIASPAAGAARTAP